MRHSRKPAVTQRATGKPETTPRQGHTVADHEILRSAGNGALARLLDGPDAGFQPGGGMPALQRSVTYKGYTHLSDSWVTWSGGWKAVKPGRFDSAGDLWNAIESAYNKIAALESDLGSAVEGLTAISADPAAVSAVLTRIRGYTGKERAIGLSEGEGVLDELTQIGSAADSALATARHTIDTARREAEEQARREAAAREKREEEARLKREADEKAKREEEERLRKEEEDRQRKAAEEKSQKEAAEKARQEEEKAQRQAADQEKRRIAAQQKQENIERMAREKEAAEKKRVEATARRAAELRQQEEERRKKAEAAEERRKETAARLEQTRVKAEEERARKEAERRAAVDKRVAEAKVRLAGEHAKLGGWYTGGGGDGLVAALSNAVVERRAAEEGRLTGDDTNDGAIVTGYQRFVTKANEAHGAVASLLNELAGSPARDNNPFNKRLDDTVSELRSYGPVPSIIGQLRALEAEATELRSLDGAIRTGLNHAVATLAADDDYKTGPKRAAQDLLRALTLGLGVTDAEGLRRMHSDLKRMVAAYEADRAKRAYASGTPEGRFLAAPDKVASARDMVDEGKLSPGYIRRTYRTSYDGPGEFSVDVVVGGFDLVIIHAHCFADGTLKPNANAVHFKRSAFSEESWAIPAGGNPDLRSRLMPSAATIKSHREDPTKLHV